VLLASGTGFAPIKALIEHMQFMGITRPTTLYWGGRRPHDLYLHDWVLAQVRRDAQPDATCRWCPTPCPKTPGAAAPASCTRPCCRILPDLSGHQVYACGAPIVVDSAAQGLRVRRPAARRVFCRLLHQRGGQTAD
jgi:CDP-4-dehydro-6-deoxyglucose reductase